MQFRAIRYAIRFLPAVMMAVSGTAPGYAVAPADQTGQVVHAHPPAKLADRQPEHPTTAARHHEKLQAHKAAELHGKTQAATAKGAEQKAHTAAPVAIIPPPPKPTADTADNSEPPPKLPRFEALKTDDTNMRKGPGQRYPIEWVYKRQNLPMEIERQYDVWRYVKDPDGIEGWVHQVTLSDRRTFMIQGKDATLRSEPGDTASPVAVLKVGVIGRLRECDQGSTWCQVQVSGYRGYLQRDQIWGLLPDEVVGAS